MGRKARNGAMAAIEPGIIAGATARTTLRRAAVLLMVLANALPIVAQSATGDIRGAAVEQLGGPLVGVSIVVTNTATGVARRTTTNSEGLFSVAGLEPGTYEVAGTLEGFAAGRQEGIHIAVGQAIVSRIELRKALLPETITLTPSPPALERLRTDVGDVITTAEIDNLPLVGRDVLDLAALAPGVTRAATSSGISVAGLPPAMNILLVDGTEARHDADTDAAFRRHTPYTFGRNGVHSLRVSTFAPPAEYGGAGGALIAVATPSGSNRLKGQLFESFRDSAIQAESPEHLSLGLPKPLSRSNQFGGVVGGPLLRNRHFFLASYEGLRERDEQIVFLNTPDVPADPLASAAVAQLTPLASSWGRTRDQDLLLVRTDHQLADGHRLMLRYDLRDLAGTNVAAGGPQTSLEVTGPSAVRSRSIGASVGSAISNTLFNDLRVRYARDQDLGGVNGDSPQADVREGGALVLRLGRNALSPRDSRSVRLRVADTLMWVQGRHAFRTGLDVRVDNVSRVFSEHLGGAYSFRTLAGFAAGVPDAPGDSYTQSFLREDLSSLIVHPDSDDYAAFVQDKWQVTDTVTLDMGLRYDLQLADASIDVDRNNWGPRLGVAWAPSSRYVVRAAYGIVYGRVPATLTWAAQAYNGVDVRMVTLRGGSGEAVPAYPNRIASIPAGLRSTIVSFDRRFENPRVQQASAGVDWEWMPNTLLSVTVLHARGDNLPHGEETNVAPGPFGIGGRGILLKSDGASTYDAATIEMRRRLAQGFQYRVSYTLGKTVESVPLTTIVIPETPFDRTLTAEGSTRDGRAPGAQDQRHRILASLVIFTDGFAERQSGVLKPILDDWRIGAIYTIQGGRPYTAYVDVDLDGDGNRFNDIAPGTTRNGFRTKREGRFDARFAREFALRGRIRLTASLDVFNLTNATHYRAVDGTLYTALGTTLFRNPQFGERTDAREPRFLQLGVTLGF